MAALLSVADARQKLLARFAPTAPETVPLDSAAGRVLAEEVRSAIDLPVFDNSSMDGFALRSEDVVGAGANGAARLRVVDDIPAGSNPQTSLAPGQAARIMTGAPLPPGADAVVPVEDTDFNQRNPGTDPPEWVEVYRSVESGAYVRRRGHDVRLGELVLPAARRLRPQEIGFLAMLGVPEVKVHRLPKIGILSSGDELVPLGEKLTPGKIHDSNTYMLVALVEKYGGFAYNLGVACDDAADVQARLDAAVEQGVDLILSSAGVSVGAFDYVRSVIEEGGELSFWRVNMRPGKPLAFGEYRGVAFIGLPGNPVSSFVGFEVFVRDAILSMSGIRLGDRKSFPTRMLEEIHSDGRESYLRAIVEETPDGSVARLTGHQGSGNLRSLVRANALLVVPSGVQFVPVGDEVQYWPLDEA